MSDSETSSLGGGPYGRSASRASSSRSGMRRGKDVERILSTASAPPEDDAEPTPPLPPPTKAPVRLDNERVFKRIAEQLSLLEDTETLLSLALVSKRASAAVTPVLYEAPVLASLRSTKKLSEVVAGSYDHSGLVKRLIIKPIGGPVKNLFEPLQIVTAACSDLTTFDEDFSTSDWDVTTLQTDYPAIGSRLRTFTSRRCWWEIGALRQLLQTQPELRELKILGALMDREWEGERINTLPSPPIGLAPHLTSITLTQVLHEETLSALFRTAGTSSLRVLRLGFEQIDQDTPRASIVDAVRLLGATLTHLAIVAPSKSSPDAEGLLDDIVPFLPHLVTLEFAEQANNPIATRHLLSVLPKSLRVLRARSVVSFSSSRLLALLDDPEAKIPASLEELDVFWAEDRPDREVMFRERHRARILSASDELGIRCSVGMSDNGLEAW